MWSEDRRGSAAFNVVKPLAFYAASTEVARNVERIIRMAEENNTAVSETASTANRLEGLATQLQGNVARFRVLQDDGPCCGRGP